MKQNLSDFPKAHTVSLALQSLCKPFATLQKITLIFVSSAKEAIHFLEWVITGYTRRNNVQINN